MANEMEAEPHNIISAAILEGSIDHHVARPNRGPELRPELYIL